MDDRIVLVGAKLKKEQSYADSMAVVNQIFPRPSRVTQTPKHCSKNWWKKDLIPHHLLMFLLLNIQVEPLTFVDYDLNVNGPHQTQAERE